MQIQTRLECVSRNTDADGTRNIFRISMLTPSIPNTQTGPKFCSCSLSLHTYTDDNRKNIQLFYSGSRGPVKSAAGNISTTSHTINWVWTPAVYLRTTAAACSQIQLLCYNYRSHYHYTHSAQKVYFLSRHTNLNSLHEHVCAVVIYFRKL